MLMSLISDAFPGLLAGACMVGSGFPLALQKIGPNRWYGFRVSRTLADPSTWYEVNRVVGRDLVVSGLVVLVASLLVAWLRADDRIRLPVGSITGGIVLTCLLVVGVHGYWVLGRR